MFSAVAAAIIRQIWTIAIGRGGESERGKGFGVIALF
jgi:hypothetical protein